MRAVNLPGLGVADDLHKTFGFRGGHGLAGRGERELADLVGQALFLRGLLRQAGARHLGLAVGAAREILHALRLAETEHALHRIDRLVGGHMRQPRRPDDVTRGIDALHARLVIVAHLHVIAVKLELHLGRKHALEVRHHADRGQHRLRLHFLALAVLHEGELDGRFPDAEIFALRARMDDDALFLERAVQCLRDFLVLHRQDLREHLDERHL